MEMGKIKIVFFGTPEFAAAQLENLIVKGYQIVAVVTAVDKPAGRGKQLLQSAVKSIGLSYGIPVLQPEKLKDESFISQLKALNADLFIVIAFRMLPESVWKMPPMGTFNLHASMLPQYRGAAPINRAIMNGETLTGLTTFFINDAIDTGNIILQKQIKITAETTAGELQLTMTEEGKSLVTDTIEKIENQTAIIIKQDQLIMKDAQLKEAPKLFKSDRQINWGQSGIQIYNQIRGLSPQPTAITELVSNVGTIIQLKVFQSKFEPSNPSEEHYKVVTDHKTFLKIVLPDGYLYLLKIQQAGKKIISVVDFLRGVRLNGYWKVK